MIDVILLISDNNPKLLIMEKKKILIMYNLRINKLMILIAKCMQFEFII